MVKWLKNNKWLILILLLASFLRVYRLDYLELFGDEVDAGYQSYSLLSTGRDYKGHLLPSYAQSFSEWRAPGLMYAMMPFIKIFGLNEWGVRLCPAFFGVLSILAFYFLLKEIGVSKKVSLWTSFLLTILPWHIQYSRAAYELTLMSSMLILGLLFWIKALNSKKKLFILISGIFFVCALYTYNTANLYVPLLVLISVLIYGWQWKKMGRLFLIGLILCLPLIKNIIWGSAASRFNLFSVWNSQEISSQVISLRNLSSNKFDKIFYNKYSLSIRRIAFNYTNAFGSDFLFNQGDVTFRQSLHHVGNLFWICGALGILGIFLTIIKREKLSSTDKLMLYWLLIAPIPSSLTIDGYNHASRLFLLIFPLIYWSAKGFSAIKGKWLYLAIVILLLEFVYYQYYYWQNYKKESWRWWHSGYKELMSSINKVDYNYSRVLIDNTYEPALIRYLFWNKIDPKKVFNLVDQMNTKLDGYYEAFKLPETNVYFVDFKGPIKSELIEKNTLYAFSQTINVVGERDINVDKIDNVNIIKTVRNYDGTPIFYLVTKK